MTDSTLNRFMASGTNAERLAFTPSPPTPASGPDPMYIWTETDTGNVFVWDPTSASWTQINIGSSPEAIAQTTFLQNGGQVVWVEDYVFNVSAATYYISGVFYSSIEQDVTLDAADATNDRIDIIALDNTSTVIKITGTASAQPSEPDVDPGTQLKLAIVFVEAATTEPAAPDIEIIYEENTGDPPEWDWTTSGVGFDVNSTNNPRTGTKCIEGTTVAANAYAEGDIDASGTVDTNSFDQLVMYIRSKAAWNNNRGLRITFRDINGVQIGTPVDIRRSGTFGFDSTVTGVYQQVAIPTWNFAIPEGTLSGRLRVTDFGGSIGFYIDDISLRGNVLSQPGTGITQEEADARYAPLAAVGTAAITNAQLANAAAWSMKIRNAGTSGVVSDAALANFTTATPISGDFVPGFLSTGEIRKFDASNFLSAGGITQLTGDVTAGPGSGSQAATIAANAVTFAKMQAITDLRLLGASGGTAVEEISVGTGLAFLGNSIINTGGGGGGAGSIYPAFTNVVLGDFTAINSASATTNANGGVYLRAPASGTENVRPYVRTAPSTPYTITAAILGNMVNANTIRCGLCWRQSSDGKLITNGLTNSVSDCFIEQLDFGSPTSSPVSNALVTYFHGAKLTWFQISDDGTNRIARVSADGYNWLQTFSEGRTVHLTADQVGFFADTTSSTWASDMTIFSWVAT